MVRDVPERCYVNWTERVILGSFLGFTTIYFLVAAAGASDRPGLAAVGMAAALISAAATARLASSMIVLRREGSFVIRGTFVTLQVPDGAGFSAGVEERHVGLIPRARLVITTPDGIVRDMGRWGLYAPRRGRRRVQIEHVAALINRCAAHGTSPAADPDPPACRGG